MDVPLIFHRHCRTDPFSCSGPAYGTIDPFLQVICGCAVCCQALFLAGPVLFAGGPQPAPLSLSNRGSAGALAALLDSDEIFLFSTYKLCNSEPNFAGDDRWIACISPFVETENCE